jgi:hypothetical protein
MQMRRSSFWPLAAVWVFCCGALSVQSAETRAPEAEVRAAIVFNVLLFVGWPEIRNASASTVRLCIIEDDATAIVLRSRFEGESVGKAKLVFDNLNESGADPSTCNAVFIGGNNPTALYRTATALRGQPILVFGEGNLAMENGAMIGLVLSGNRYVIDLNLGALQRERLSVSSKLIRLARKVLEK